MCGEGERVGRAYSHGMRAELLAVAWDAHPIARMWVVKFMNISVYGVIGTAFGWRKLCIVICSDSRADAVIDILHEIKCTGCNYRWRTVPVRCLRCFGVRSDRAKYVSACLRVCVTVGCFNVRLNPLCTILELMCIMFFAHHRNSRCDCNIK